MFFSSRLCRQQLDDSAASLLAKSLIDNTAITHVDLACNNIGDDGAVALANGIGTASQLVCVCFILLIHLLS